MRKDFRCPRCNTSWSSRTCLYGKTVYRFTCGTVFETVGNRYDNKWTFHCEKPYLKEKEYEPRTTWMPYKD